MGPSSGRPVLAVQLPGPKQDTCILSGHIGSLSFAIALFLKCPLS